MARTAATLARLVPERERVLVAVSGGPDSVALLDLLVRGARIHGRSLVVGHVDHGISADSGQVAGQVAELAGRSGLDYDQERLALDPDASETLARRERRRALRRIAARHRCGAIALAHHADDQAETVLLRLLRGSGPAGLAAMAPRRGIWVRPLLEIDRTALVSHLERRGLSSWQDPANQDPRHLRSWLRIVVLPLLLQRDESFRDGLLSVARHAGRDRRAWNAVPALLDSLELRQHGGRISVAAAPLAGYRSEVQHAILAALGRRIGVPLGTSRIEAVMGLLAAARSGAKVVLSPELEAEIAFDRLLLRRPEPTFQAVPLVADGITEAGGARLRSTRVVAGGGALERGGARTLLPAGNYLVRPWRSGDRVRPIGGRGSRSVVRTLREHRVAAGDRHRWPVVVAAEDEATIVWVPGICRAGIRIPAAGTEALDVEFDLA